LKRTVNEIFDSQLRNDEYLRRKIDRVFSRNTRSSHYTTVDMRSFGEPLNKNNCESGSEIETTRNIGYQPSKKSYLTRESFVISSLNESQYVARPITSDKIRRDNQPRISIRKKLDFDISGTIKKRSPTRRISEWSPNIYSPGIEYKDIKPQNNRIPETKYQKENSITKLPFVKSSVSIALASTRKNLTDYSALTTVSEVASYLIARDIPLLSWNLGLRLEGIANSPKTLLPKLLMYLQEANVLNSEILSFNNISEIVVNRGPANHSGFGMHRSTDGRVYVISHKTRKRILEILFVEPGSPIRIFAGMMYFKSTISNCVVKFCVSTRRTLLAFSCSSSEIIDFKINSNNLMILTNLNVQIYCSKTGLLEHKVNLIDSIGAIYFLKNSQILMIPETGKLLEIYEILKNKRKFVEIAKSTEVEENEANLGSCIEGGKLLYVFGSSGKVSRVEIDQMISY